MLRRNVRIEWGDCDPAGIVFYPRYLDQFNESTIQLFETAGFGRKRDMQRELQVAGFPMVDVRTSFRRPTTYGDEVVITSRIAEMGRSSFKVEHQLWLGEELCVECWETRVWTVVDPDDSSRLKSAPIPQAIRDKIGPKPEA